MAPISVFLIIGLIVAVLVVHPVEEATNENEYGIYLVSNQMCCNGVINNEIRDSCCGTEPINHFTSVCCNGTKVGTFNPLKRPFQCCHDLTDGTKVKLFYPKLEICCQGKVLRKQDSYKAYQCCGDRIYDAYTQICCHGVVHAFQFDATCCGQQLVHLSDTAGSVEHANCCGQAYWFDPRKELCCTVPNSKRSKEGDPKLTYYDTAIHEITGSTDSNLRCCGLEAFDPSKEVCCTSKNTSPYKLNLPAVERSSSYYQTPTCCLDKVIVDNVAEICCDGRVIKRSAPSIKCCNDDILYDSKSMMCCGRNILEVNTKKTCCPRAGTYYDAAHQTCCNDKITPYVETLSKVPVTRCCNHS